MITCSVKLEDYEDEFFCSFIYALNSMEEQKELWKDLQDHSGSLIIRQKPWMLMGDFNEILDVEEHSSFEYAPIITPGMQDFQEITNQCSLVDLALHGPLYTWCNKRENYLILKKLDRVLVNDEWMQIYPQSYSVFEAGGCSDHLRCRIHLSSNKERRKSPFKFVNAITELAEFKPLLEQHWKESEQIFMSTSSLFRFSKKLKSLKPLIRTLAKHRLGNLVKKTKEAFTNLCNKQKENLQNPSLQAMEEENAAYKRWDFLSRLEEKYLKQKSKLHWLNIGDKNNKSFHRAVTSREARNSIHEIQRQDGTIATKSDEIKTEAERFFVSSCNTLRQTTKA